MYVLPAHAQYCSTRPPGKWGQGPSALFDDKMPWASSISPPAARRSSAGMGYCLGIFAYLDFPALRARALRRSEPPEPGRRAGCPRGWVFHFLVQKGALAHLRSK